MAPLSPFFKISCFYLRLSVISVYLPSISVHLRLNGDSRYVDYQILKPKKMAYLRFSVFSDPPIWFSEEMGIPLVEHQKKPWNMVKLEYFLIKYEESYMLKNT